MGFVMPHAIILVAGGVVGLALLFQIVGLATPGWTTWEPFLGLPEGNEGLWEKCFGDNCAKFTGDIPDWFSACRAFGILGVLAMAASLICAVLTCFMSDKAKMFTLVAAGAAAVGAVCSLIEFAVYAGKDPFLSSQHISLGYSFALTVVAFVLAVVAVALFIVGQRKVQ
ncbi:uncharacterized protein LOC143291143 [Babylonia areolata]|uniref:uncharacterized protein LOC143291143 n=1 Tax=Babylonia areolata TaxID=304850 RepID=UPI003FD3252C